MVFNYSTRWTSFLSTVCTSGSDSTMIKVCTMRLVEQRNTTVPLSRVSRNTRSIRLSASIACFASWPTLPPPPLAEQLSGNTTTLSQQDNYFWILSCWLNIFVTFQSQFFFARSQAFAASRSLRRPDEASEMLQKLAIERKRTDSERWQKPNCVKKQ